MPELRNVTIKTFDEKRRPIKSHVRLIVGGEFRDSPEPSHWHVVPSSLGYLGLRYELVIEAKDEGYHPFRIEECTANKNITLRRISEESIGWAEHFVLGDRGRRRCNSIKIGVIDGYPPSSPKGLRHIAISKWSNAKGPGVVSPDIMAHGVNVVNLVSNFLSLGGGSESDSEGPEVVVYPVHCRQINGMQFLPIDVIEAALQAAITDGCDIINLSLGIEDEATDLIHGELTPFSRELIHAKSNDVIIVAATGNEVSEKVHLPASNDFVFGIGMLGLASEVTVGSAAERYMIEAERSVDFNRMADDPRFGRVFVAGAVGRGADFVFPGCGVCLVDNAGRPVEVSGTSFAAPIATAVLARVMSDMQIYVNGSMVRPSADEVWEHVRGLTVRLGEEPWFATIRY